MASVTFPIGLGGDGSTVTDDSNATTGLGNGGHRARFVPALYNMVAMANTAATRATTASTQASNASSSASAASTSATNANNSFLSFDKRYLGSKTGDPTLDNQGAALLTGAIYWNSSTNLHRVWSGSAWSNVVASSGAFADNNFIINDNIDSTKKFNFEVSGVGTGTTITLTVPNASGTLLTSASGMAPLASPTFTGTVTTGINIISTGTAGTNRILYFNTGATNRWALGTNSGAETGSNAGSDFIINRFDDTGVFIDKPFGINRATGIATISTSLTLSGASGLSLTNGTSNLISFGTAGMALPAFTTRSAGTKIVYYPRIDASNADYATGIHSTGVLWNSVPATAQAFAWYGGTSLAATLTGAGDLSLAGGLTTTGTTGLSLTNGTSNLISFGTAGAALPAFTTRSAGTKIVYYPRIDATNADYATGIHSSGVLWNSVPATAQSFAWYGGTTLAATLTGTGDFIATGTVSGSSATGFRNKAINGGMDIDQRNNGAAVTTDGAYPVDRWQAYIYGTGSAQRIAMSNTPEVPGFSYFTKFIRTAAGSNFSFLSTKIEGVKNFSGKQMMLSFWIRGDVINASGWSITSYVADDSGTFQAYSPNTGATIAITSTWMRVQLRMDVPSITTALGANGGYMFIALRCSSASENFNISTTGWTWEEGAVATPSERRPTSLELSLCQRYYQQFGQTVATEVIAAGQAYTTSNAIFYLPLKTTMRATPTITVNAAANFSVTSNAFSTVTLNSLAGYSSTQDEISLITTTSSASLAAGNATMLVNGVSGLGRIYASAEL